MLGHDFVEAPGKRVEIGFNPNETVMMLRCRWCNNTPSKSREDGCPTHELTIIGKIRLDMFNPDGLTRFVNRLCVTCREPIMDHWIRNEGTTEYFCREYGAQTSEGITDCVWDVPDGFGTAPERV